MKSKNITDYDEVEKMIDIAEVISKIPAYIIKSKSRRMEVLAPRMAISNIARLERGIHYNTIAEVLCRDRCSVYHYEKNHENNYKYWSDYRDTFNNIVLAINSSKLEKPNNFNNNKELKDFIIDRGRIFESPNGKVFISVRLDKLKTDIQTNYRDFSSTLSRIQYCLHDYNAKIDISL
tara:strand:- start:19 stop:552 length:534 start_codon:yes stop_codon:yes gene_type:complete